MPALLPLCPVPRLRHLAQVGLFLLIGCTAAQADERWSVRLLGIKVGELALTYALGPARYDAHAAFHTTGVAGALSKVGFRLRGSGRVTDGALHPKHYHEEMDTGRRHSTAELTFQHGHRIKISGRVATTTPAEVANLKDPLDPLSALLTVLAQTQAAPTCQLNRDVYDGARHTRIVLNRGWREGKKTVCHGQYQRIAGYSDAQLKEAAAFDLRLTYMEQDRGWTLFRAKIHTLYGPVNLKQLR